MNSGFQAQLLAGERQGLAYALAVPASALSGLTGNLLGRQAGTSIDFQEHRDYQPGDDLRRIDWNIYARSDRLVVKLYREEVNPHLDLVLDGSRSMALEETRKAEALCRLAAVLAVAADNAGCSRAVWLSQRGFRRVPNDRTPPSAWREIDFNGAQSLAEDLVLLPPTLRRQGIRVVVSDLFWLGDPLPVMRRLADNATQVWVIQLLAQADLNPPAHGSVRLRDSESGEEQDLYIDAQVEKRYRESLAEHQRQWELACRQTRSRLIPVVAESLLGSDSLRPLEQAGLLLAS
jgi:uncharacterized protein (DUF58 family)